MMNRYNLALTLFLILVLNKSNLASTTSFVVTNHGLVQGKVSHILNGDIHSFLGIRYAQPPTNNLRFKPALPWIQNWQGIYNATYYKSSCPQYSSKWNCLDYNKELLNGQPISEDCLYLNIYTPIPNVAGNKSVLVWFHNGDFNCGSGSLWDPSALASTEEMVIVTVNYRLGALGFLTSGQDSNTDSEIPANLALRDQQLALTWIKDNIVRFGGRSNDIGIVGSSAGAISVGLHTVIPSSGSLFTSAILQSGTPLSPHAIKTKNQAQIIFQQFTSATNCSRNTLNLTIECLQSLSISTISQQQEAILSQFPQAFTPVIDGQFIPDDPKVLLSSGQFNKVQIMLGSNMNDGSKYLAPLPNITKGLSRAAFKTNIVAQFSNFNNVTLSAMIYKYTDWTNKTSLFSNRAEYEKLYNDYYYAKPIVETANLYSSYVTTYMYVFAYRTESDTYFPSYYGVAHSMEIPYVFGYPLLKPNNLKLNYTEHEERISKHLMSLWGSFIYDRSPISRVSTINWRPYVADTRLYCYINTVNSEIRSFYIADRVEFWNTLIPQINIPLQIGTSSPCSTVTQPSNLSTNSPNFTTTQSSNLSSPIILIENSTSTFDDDVTGSGSMSPFPIDFSESSLSTSDIPTRAQTTTHDTSYPTQAQSCSDIQMMKTIFMICTFALAGIIGVLIIIIIILIIKLKKSKTAVA